MESPSLARYIPQKSKKRVFSSSNSSIMDSEVVEIVPPINRGSTSRSLEQKEVSYHEIIDVDMDEDEGMVVDEKFVADDKGKAIQEFSDFRFYNQVQQALNIDLLSPGDPMQLGLENGFLSPERSAFGSHKQMGLDGFDSSILYEVDANNDPYYEEPFHEDDYELIQACFDKMDIPAGVEAPVSSLFHPVQRKKRQTTETSSAPKISHIQLGLDHPEGTVPSQSSRIADNFRSKTELSTFSTQRYMMLEQQLDNVNSLHRSSSLFPGPGKSKRMPSGWGSSSYSSSQKCQKSDVTVSLKKPPSIKKPALSSTSYYHHLEEQSNGMQPFPPTCTMKQPIGATDSFTYAGGTNLFTKTGLPTKMDLNKVPYGGGPSMPPWQDAYSSTNKSLFMSHTSYDPFWGAYSEDEAYMPWYEDSLENSNLNSVGHSTIPFESMPSKNLDDIMEKFQLFKQFDTVRDHSDHRYTGNGRSLKQPSKSWAKKIQEEWRILEKSLPDTIFVRVYEARMDLLRAVIVGAEGTPYHDGLFFFDVFFPDAYPNVPPLVHYHSGGLRLNPNLYNCGKVCLSLLNTWAGGKNERWIPGVSTILQVLVSIQALILNANPYFNEPGYEHLNGSPAGETKSRQYNESTFILSLKTMQYTMRKPPKHFEDFVAGHFGQHAHDILVACKAYMDGAQVGCLVKGGIQDVDEGDKSCSNKFKAEVARHVEVLVGQFSKLGVKDCGKFCSPSQEGNKGAHSSSMAAPT